MSVERKKALPDWAGLNGSDEHQPLLAYSALTAQPEAASAVPRYQDQARRLLPDWQGLDDDIYMQPHEIDALLRRPHELNGLWQHCIPNLTSLRPLAVLARQIATPNYETLWFLRLARRHGFQSVIIEHRSDRFTVNNAAKRHLGRLPVLVGRSRDGRVIVRHQKLLDPTEAEGRKLLEVQTFSGESLLGFHHRKLLDVLGPETPTVIDMSQVLRSSGQRPSVYYVEFFRLLVGSMVLFEDFVVDERTAEFFCQVVRPAYQQVVEETGMRPQILKLTPGPQMSSSLWTSYPAAVASDPVRNEGSLLIGS